ncbi:MAG: hypothetical protein QMD44_08190 [Thermodesulfovibrionales bacterium]|nr:hypothetical protein [Thermodesulfovibrionales bacterium]
MLLQDIIEGKVASSQRPEVVHRLLFTVYGQRIKLFFVVCCLFSVFCLLFSAIYSYAQQPATQQKSPASLEEERLTILKADIKKEIERLEKIKKEIEEAQKALDIKIQEGLLKVAKMYEAMPSEEAARKLEKLDEDAAVIILNSLKPKTAGKILAQMDNDKAASLSKKILIKGKVLQEKTSR